MIRVRMLARVLTAVPVLMLGVACGSDPLAPFQPEIANTPGNFQLQATGLTNVSATQEYTWQNAGTTANINKSGAITGGTATLTIRDANNVQVHSSSLATTGTVATSAGTAGAWKIRLVLQNVSGTVNFRVQTP